MTPPCIASIWALLLVSVLASGSEISRVDITVEALQGRSEDLAVLRSSSFFVPKTAAGLADYLATPGGHRATRIGVFEQALAESTDEKSFLANLERYREPLTKLCGVTDRLVIVIAKMPAWLSRLPQAIDPIGDAGWRRFHAQPPRDYAQWRRIVAAGVRWFGGFAGARRDFEIWNEPDLFSWKATTTEFMEFYTETAQSIRGADPAARIGGPALNGWRGSVPGDSGGDLIVQLIRYVGKRQVPLDFVSWHWFSAEPGDIVTAAEEYRRAGLDAGMGQAPELQISEWNVPSELRGTPFAAALHAEAFLGFIDAGISAQMVAAWEDFTAHPAGFSDYGLITQQGIRKPVWHVHRFFDALSRQSSAWTSVRQGSFRVLVARGQGEQPSHRLICWERSVDPRLAALDVLRHEVSLVTLAATYKDAATLLSWVVRGRSMDGKHDRLFANARSAMEATALAAKGRISCVVRVTGLPAAEVFKGRAVKSSVRDVLIDRRGDSLSFELERNEVLMLASGLAVSAP
ncbi:MAG: hypothetical protein AAB263_06235 [Planctomycetota bacterium]